MSYEERLARALAVIETNKAAEKAKRNAAKTKWRKENPGYNTYYMQRYREKYPGRRRATEKNSQLKQKFGITLQQRDNILGGQGYTCAVCGGSDPGFRDWNVDHCHTTNTVRGVLCSGCNLMLGFAKDNPDVLEAGAEYLRQHNERIRETRSEQPPDPATNPLDGSRIQPSTRYN